MSNGDLYTILTNKEAHGGKGCMVAIIKGVQSEYVIGIINRIPEVVRENVKEITMDMANSMHKIARNCFRYASRVIDRFHVQKLVNDAVQEIRIKYRWEAIKEESDAIEEAKKRGISYRALYLSNGDTKKQLLARSRYLLFKSPKK